MPIKFPYCSYNFIVLYIPIYSVVYYLYMKALFSYNQGHYKCIYDYRESFALFLNQCSLGCYIPYQDLKLQTRLMKNSMSPDWQAI